MLSHEYVLCTNGSMSKEKVNAALQEAAKTVKRNIGRFGSGEDYPVQIYKDGKYCSTKNGDKDCWTQGFWPGQLWLCYEITGEEIYRQTAQKCVDNFYKRVYDNHMIDWHHDIGFLYSPSCVASHKLTKNTTALEAAKMAAYSLSRRFRHRGEFIQSLGFELEEENYRFIADTMLNLPLLFWMTEESGESMYREKAKKHLDTTLRYLVREDGSSYHHFLMDFKTGGPRRGLTWQGHSDDSCWSRGQAWLVLGLAIAYSYLREEYILEAFYKVTDYFLAHLPADNIPYWDLCFTSGEQSRDSSAAAIVVCGILEMARNVNELNGKIIDYCKKAEDMLNSLIDNYAIPYSKGEEGILSGVTDANPQGIGVVSEPYGDYFYIEALVRASRNWNKYW